MSDSAKRTASGLYLPGILTTPVTVRGPEIQIAKFQRPKHITLGEDGLPDFITGERGSPLKWRNPSGWRVDIYHEGLEIRDVIEADRKRGWARCLHGMEDGEGNYSVARDTDGSQLFRFYQGRIEFRLVRRAAPHTLKIEYVPVTRMRDAR